MKIKHKQYKTLPCVGKLMSYGISWYEELRRTLWYLSLPLSYLGNHTTLVRHTLIAAMIVNPGWPR